MATYARDVAIREAKLHVREIVRNDWSFHPSTDAGAPASSSPPPPTHEIAEWRLREYDSSGSELEPVSSPDIGASDHTVLPDSLRAMSPRRKRRRQEEEAEMRWNEGLRTWVERRNAWSGALSREEIRRRQLQPRDSQLEDGALSHDDQKKKEEASNPTLESSTSSAGSGCDELTTRTEVSLSITEREEFTSQFPADREREDEPSTADPENLHPTASLIPDPDLTTGVTPTTPAPAPASVAATETAASYHDPSTGDQQQQQEEEREREDPFIPVAPTLISTTNPVRAAIAPTMYPSIYSKVVVQGLTPTVPINLVDVTKAIVQGWKADGQWPPKPATSNIVLQDDATVRKPNNALDQASPESKKRSGVASAVRKVLHFSGFHPHRRSSSHGQNDVPTTGEGNGIVDQTIPNKS
ncbi:hypothetical protein EYZ11_004681 [Aspergillus tanneri]|uniref:Gag1-like clamp domain-containing protein n=1 Tax=Aspergillus tanneri TaxID=1220188 RepID=A0A4V3UPN1_9EURO|nr:uncharacterized protein ATNIH1004_008394 [Aspergillus tanneri]KAA8644195.1 hypothetical protein ATNIH1004_008394 [Aspergillus tanneri]THC95854.1 hypothetical protein EYZ11_004681 [Aspergillus tanneri]